MEPECPNPEIKVTDRRRFTTDGEPLDTAEEEQASTTPSQPEAPRPEPPPENIPLPPANFSTLVISLRFEVEMQLGFYGAPDETRRPPDLEGARHTIDLLGVLQEKTRGNLSLEEQRLLENTLTELRFRYVQTLEGFTHKK